MKIQFYYSEDDGINVTFVEAMDGKYYHPHGCVDPDGRIWLVYWEDTGGSTKAIGKTKVCHSDDFGATWSAPVEIYDGYLCNVAVWDSTYSYPEISVEEDGVVWVKNIMRVVGMIIDSINFYSVDDGATWTQA